jgi:DNA processing protein
MDLQAAVALSLLSGIPRPAIIDAVRRLGPAPGARRPPEASNTRRVLEALGCDRDTVDALEPPLHRGAADALQRAARRKLTAIPWTGDAYPPPLLTIADPPLVVWLRGALEALKGPAIALVGSRAGSPYALQVAERLAAELVARGVVVVSGLARGVDAAAHRGALQAGGRTVAVLGSGVDVWYTAEHRELGERICATGAVVSELVPGTPPRKEHFPSRNRIISGLSLGVVVVEASEKSGSLITARCALDQGREVMAVPGNILSGRNRGAHALIRDGARIVETADDVVEQLRLPAGAAHRGFDKRDPWRDDPVLRHMVEGELYDLDTLVQNTGLATDKLLPRLLQLELDGLIARGGMGRFLRAADRQSREVC